MGDPDERQDGRGAEPGRRGGGRQEVCAEVEPMSLEAAHAMQGTGWEGDLDAMREGRVWEADLDAAREGGAGEADGTYQR